MHQTTLIIIVDELCGLAHEHNCAQSLHVRPKGLDPKRGALAQNGSRADVTTTSSANGLTWSTAPRQGTATFNTDSRASFINFIFNLTLQNECRHFNNAVIDKLAGHRCGLF
ncbi:hypothetical protein EVAR_17046_1 [Eumeta japonica]|uniref:Uncharacterized protein n=1 Tax=Eumeta variegata TaxID=151549 RepID=A0A4C1V559_EUMVA|nr:hypothetical protein EVAR_17046_1 [Eumeta japonica]